MHDRFKWQVKVAKEAETVLKSGVLSDDDMRIIHAWTLEVMIHGPDILLNKPNVWADHELSGKWKGYRSSRYSYSGRIIYKIEKKVVTVVVVRITPDHDYK